MLTSEQLLNYQLTKAGMNGYKAIEVDELITSAAETVSFYEKKMHDLQRKLEEMKKDENIIQTTLVNAQKLANQLTEDAQSKADAVVAEATKKAEQITAENEARVSASTEKAEKNIREMIETAKSQAASILDSAKRTADEVAAAMNAEQDKQKKLLAVLKNEVAAFRNDILRQYKEQVQLIDRLPHEIQNIRVESEDAKPEPAAKPVEKEPQTAAGSNLVKIFGEMKDNEAAAVSAVEEVAELTADEAGEPEKAAAPAAEAENAKPAEEAAAPQPSEEAKPEQPAKPRPGGFSIMLDDED